MKLLARLFGLMVLTASPALAGQQYCSDDADTYYVEKIPFGYAFVRIAQADFCKQDISSDDPTYVCDGDSEYKATFKREGKDLAVALSDGQPMKFTPCTFENPDAYKE